MKVYIPIHSVVDVITNSSSVIYTEAKTTSINILKELIDEILSIAESPKTADDLFNISLQVMPDEGIASWLSETDITDDLPQHISEMIQQVANVTGDWRARSDLANSLAETHEAELCEYLNTLGPSNDDESYPMLMNNLVVKVKNGIDTKFAERILSMFDIRESYNG